MNTNKTLITKQEAATSADLSQQEPHLEVVKVMHSVASSDEERLAAGNSTIGLQTKRLSGELWEVAELSVVESKELPKGPRVIVRIPDTSEVTTVMIRLRIQNPELNTTDWSVVNRKFTEKEQTGSLY